MLAITDTRRRRRISADQHQRQHDQLQSTSRQHNPASPTHTTPTTQRQTGAKENSILDVQLQKTMLARYHTQQQRLGCQSARDDDLPANYTATRPSQLNQRKAEDDHTLTKRHSQGRGRGKLKAMHGDVPISFTTRPQPTTTHDTHNTTTQTTRRDSTTKTKKRSQSCWSRKTHVHWPATTGSTSSSTS